MTTDGRYGTCRCPECCEQWGRCPSAWQTFKALNKRRKVLVILGAPLWLPVALVAWLEADRTEEPLGLTEWIALVPPNPDALAEADRTEEGEA